MKTIVHLLLILAGLIFYSSIVAQTKSEKIDSLLSAYYDADCFNGVVLVSKKGELIFKKAYGLADRELNVQITTDMRFRIASISKPFTALIILQLVDEGIIKLDGKITDYVPDYAGKKGDSITIHQLLTHTSGILQNLDPEKEAIQERLYHSLREMIKYIEESDLYFDPGTGYHYSNLAYNLLAYIAEKVTNKSFDKLLTERVLEPLKMNNTKQSRASEIEKNLTKGYEYKLLSGYENASYIDPSFTVGPGGLISDVGDLSKLDKALYDKRLISRDLYVKMFTPTKYGSYGYGWDIRTKITKSKNDTVAIKLDTVANKLDTVANGYNKITNKPDTIQIFSHAGSINGFGSYLARIERDSILVIILKNNRTDTYISPAYAPTIGQEIISIMFDEVIPIPKKSIARHMGLEIGKLGINKSITDYYNIKRNDFDRYNFDESELNKLGIELYFRYKLPEEALRVFEVNMREFPHSYNTYDSYAYILMQKGDYQNSIKYYKLGLQILAKFPKENNSESVLKDAKNAERTIAEIETKIKSTKL